jgi:CheY-like chemotaxis protein
VVDDDIRNTYALSSLLVNHKVEVIRAEDGRKAIEILDLQPDIDLVLMDIMMPEMDGYETIRAIRIRPGKHDLPIFALTARALPEDRERCMRAGASEYLAKPIDSRRLLELIALWTAKPPNRRSVAEAQPAGK